MEQEDNSRNIIIYNTPDGKASVSLFARDGMVWMNQNQIAELFDTSVPNISMHISNILKEGELVQDSVIKNYLTTAAKRKKFEALEADKQDLEELEKKVKRRKKE